MYPIMTRRIILNMISFSCKTKLLENFCLKIIVIFLIADYFCLAPIILLFSVNDPIPYFLDSLLRCFYTVFYLACRGFSLAGLLAFTKSFAWLVCRVVGLFTPWGVNKPTTQETYDFLQKLKNTEDNTAKFCMQISFPQVEYELSVLRPWPLLHLQLHQQKKQLIMPGYAVFLSMWVLVPSGIALMPPSHQNLFAPSWQPIDPN